MCISMCCINETERKAHALVSSLNIYIFSDTLCWVNIKGGDENSGIDLQKTAGVFRRNGLTDEDFQWHHRYFKGHVNQTSIGT